MFLKIVLSLYKYIFLKLYGIQLVLKHGINRVYTKKQPWTQLIRRKRLYWNSVRMLQPYEYLYQRFPNCVKDIGVTPFREILTIF